MFEQIFKNELVDWDSELSMSTDLNKLLRHKNSNFPVVPVSVF